MKSRQFLAGFGAVGLFVGTTVSASPANALTEWDYCHVGGVYDADMSAGTTYVSSSSYWRVTQHQMTILGTGQDENNLNAQLRHGTNTPIYWAWSRGNIVSDQTYTASVNADVPKSAKPEMYTKAVFDFNGPDPSCYTLITLDGIDQ